MNRYHQNEFELFVQSSFIRKFEQKLLEIFARGLVSGTTHTSYGQEANAVGIAAASRDDDIFVSNHRCHAHVLAHVGQAEALLREIMGDRDGFCAGVGGSQHICVPDRFYSNGIQGGILPMAAGLAFALKRKRSDRIACVFMGDGTTGEGAFYEALNLVALWALPLLVVVEDNGIAQTTPTRDTIAGTIKGRFEGFGISVTELDYPTAEELLQAAKPVVERVREGVPQAIIIRSARLGPHSKGDDTRAPAEIKANLQRDPLAKMASALAESGQLDAAELHVNKLMQRLESVLTQKAQPGSTPMPQYLPFMQSHDDLRELNGRPFSERIGEALAECLSESPSAVLIGEDIGDPYGGAFKITKGLQTQYPERVLQTPISELGFTGLAGGAAMAGIRPIVEIMFGDFAMLAMDQLVNHAAKYSLMYAGQVECPLVVRLPMGGHRGYGPTHSQCIEKHFCGVPNLRVIALSPYLPLRPIYRLVKKTKAPMILVENKVEYNRKVDLQKDIAPHFDVEVTGANVSFATKAATRHETVLVAYGGTISLAIEAAKTLAEKGVHGVRVLGVSQLFPLCLEGLNVSEDQAIQHVVTIEESSVGWGFGSEVGAALLERPHVGGIQFRRIGAAETIVPASRQAEKAALPSIELVVSAVLEMRNRPEASRVAIAQSAQVAYEFSLAHIPVSDVSTSGSTWMDLLKAEAAGEVVTQQFNANDDEFKLIWLFAANGEKVAVDQAVGSVETSKSSVDLTATASGYILYTRKVDDVVLVGDCIALIYPTEESFKAALKIMSDKSQISFTEASSAQVAERVVSAEKGRVSVPRSNAGQTERVELTRVQRGMVRSLEISRTEIPAAYLMAEFKCRSNFGKGVELVDVVAYRLAALIKSCPGANAFYEDGYIEKSTQINIGFTTDVNGDLYMGVIDSADRKSLEQIAAARIETVLELYRSEKTTAMSFAPTVCVSALNGKWITHQIPIVLPRTALIIGVNRRSSEAGELLAALTFGYDHRVLSGLAVSKLADDLIKSILS